MQYAASFVGWSNTGKTRLISRLTAGFSAEGYQVGCLKQGHSGPDFETSGKDTEQFFRSGAGQVGFLSPQGGFIRYRVPPPVEVFYTQFASCDILLIEGVLSKAVPCFEVIASADRLADAKFSPESLTGYIAMSIDTAESEYDQSKLPILPGTAPEVIIKFLEELWNAKSP